MKDKNTATNFQFAGFWIRTLALILDWLLLGIIGYLLFGSEVTDIDFSDGTVGVSYTDWKTIIPISYTIFSWIWTSATPGKHACKLKIIHSDGTKLSWKMAVVRLIFYPLSLIALGLGFIWIAFDKKKQGWHDKIAKTYVIKK